MQALEVQRPCRSDFGVTRVPDADPSHRTVKASKSQLTAIGKIDGLDLSGVRSKITGSEGLRWTQARTSQAELDYRRFLKLQALYPNERVSPTKLIDDFWHYHILDTRAYAKDCEEIFGHFIHHNPYFGAGSQSEARLLEGVLANLQRLFLLEFGALPSTASSANCFSTTDDEGSDHCEPDHDDHG